MSDMGQYCVHPIRLKSVALLCVIFWVAAWGLMTTGTSWAATIQGSVRLTGAGLEQKKLPVTVDHSVCGKEKEGQEVIVSAGKGIRNVVVSLQNPPPTATWKAPLSPVQMDQQQCMFVPRVVIVPVGGTVEFLNSDRLLHNIRSRATVNRPFNRTQPKGRTIPMVFQKAELILTDEERGELLRWSRRAKSAWEESPESQQPKSIQRCAGSRAPRAFERRQWTCRRLPHKEADRAALWTRRRRVHGGRPGRTA